MRNIASKKITEYGGLYTTITQKIRQKYFVRNSITDTAFVHNENKNKTITCYFNNAYDNLSLNEYCINHI